MDTAQNGLARKCVRISSVRRWGAEDHSDDQSYYDAQNIFTADEKYHMAHPVYKMINRKFPEINPSNFDRNSDRKATHFLISNSQDVES